MDFVLTEKILHKLVCMVKKYGHAKFCQNLMNEVQMLSRNVICGVKFGRFWTFDPDGHLGFCDKREILAQACLKGQVVCLRLILSKSDEQ